MLLRLRTQMIRARSVLLPAVAGLLFILAGGLAAQSEAESKAPTAAEKHALGLELAAEYSEQEAGLAVLVYHDGELVFEQYQNGHTTDKAQHIFSGTKSFAPIVALIAESEGLLELDEKVAETITEWKGDERKEKITIRQLLNFTSGLKNIDDELHSGRAPDKYSASIASPSVREPGKHFRYGSVHLMVFGELMERKLKAASSEEQPLPEDFLAYLEQKVLEPIGCKYAFWMRDREGHPLLPYGAFFTAREWAKFGLLLLAKGRCKDEQLVSGEALEQCYVGTKANPIYGLNFWLVGKHAHARNDSIPKDTVAAAGMFNQKLYLIPSRKLVVVRFGRSRARSSFTDLKFLERLFTTADNEADPQRM